MPIIEHIQIFIWISGHWKAFSGKFILANYWIWMSFPYINLNLFVHAKNDFSTSAFDMQNHQLPHVDSSLLNLKICARIVIQSIPTNQLRPQKSFKFQIFWSFLTKFRRPLVIFDHCMSSPFLKQTSVLKRNLNFRHFFVQPGLIIIPIWVDFNQIIRR